MMSGCICAIALHGRLRFFGFAANLHVLLLIDQQRQPLAHEGMIVDNQDGLFGGLRGLFRNESLSSFAFPFELSGAHGEHAGNAGSRAACSA